MECVAHEHIVVHRPAQHIFRLLVALRFGTRIQPTISCVRGPTVLTEHVKFTRIFWSHGIPNWQRVYVEAYEPPHRLTLATRLLLMRVRYTYQLDALNEETTRITLRKEASSRTPWGSLLVHLLTAEEHDGMHLKCLRDTAESLPHGFTT